MPLQYADFAVWQRLALGGPALAALLAYWKRQLAGLPPLVELPTDRPRPAVQTFRGSTLPLALPPGTTMAVQALSRREAATPFMTLLAVFLALLHRHTGQSDLAVGSPIANRGRAELEGLIGFFVNTLVLRGDLSGDPGFRELLARLKSVAAGAYAHQDLPFEKLVEELEPERQLSHSPLFQVMFVLQNAPVPAVALSGLTLAPVPARSGTSKFDLSLYLWEGGPELAGFIEYNTDLFDPATVSRLRDHFVRLVQETLADPERRVSELPLLSPGESHRLLVEYADTVPEFRVASEVIRLHQPFEAQAARTPDAVALVAGEERLTYRELDRRANQLAHHLGDRGVGAESMVGIAMRRSADLVVSILATLKAGGAYVPLDPEYPAERLAFILADSRAPVLIVDAADATDVADGARRVCPAAEREAIAGYPETPPALPGPAGLAYVIYTSGSTGLPKGVAIEHRSALLFVHWAREVFPPRDLAGVLFSTSICFDLSVFELFVPLSWGGNDRPGRGRARSARAAGRLRGDARQHRPLGDCRAGPAGGPAAFGAHRQPRRRAPLPRRDGRDLRRAGSRAGVRPLRAVGGHHVLDLRPCRAGERPRALDRPAAARNARLPARPPVPSGARRACPASSASAATASLAATSAAPS